MKNQKYHYFKFVVDDYYRYNPEPETVEFYYSSINKWITTTNMNYDKLLKYFNCKKISEEKFKLEMLL